MPLTVRQLKAGGIYRCTLSGLRVRVIYTMGGNKPHAHCRYFNKVTGTFGTVDFHDGELEQLRK